MSEQPLPASVPPAGSALDSAPSSRILLPRRILTSHSPSFVQVLAELKVSLLISTYQAGKVVVVQVHKDDLFITYHNFDRAMGIAVSPEQIAVGTNNQIWFLVVCDLPWAVRFPKGTHAWLGQIEQGILPPAAAFSLPVHPPQLYAALSGAVILAILCAHFPRRHRDGEVMALLMILYPLTRWPIESLRGDETAVFAGMTLSQDISVGLLLLGLALWARLSRCPAGRHADIALLAEEQALPAASRQRGPGRLVAGLERAR